MNEQPKSLNDLLSDWHLAKKNAEFFAAEEVKLRKQIFGQEFPDPKRGTNKKKIDHGMALIGDYKLNYTPDRAGLEAAISAATGNERGVIDSVISYSPKVKEAAFEALDDEAKKIVAPFITVKPGLPSIEIKPQDKVRW